MKIKTTQVALRRLEGVGDTQNPVEWNKPVYPSITLLAALHRRRIPALTMTVARRGTPLRECAGIIKNDAHRVLLCWQTQGYPHSRFSGAMVEETGIFIIHHFWLM